MSAEILEFKGGKLSPPYAQPKPGAPMSQVPPLPRVDVRTYEDDRGNSIHDVEYVWTEGQGGYDVLATFKDPEAAEAFAERWMAANPDKGGGRWTGFDGGAA